MATGPEFEALWELDDGEALHAEFPSTFEIPPASERQALHTGQLVKLIFRIPIAVKDAAPSVVVERMWVVVGGVYAAKYFGTLNNDARYAKHVVSGLEVEFEARHVIQIWRE
jgi:hypothetical protein